MSTTGEHPAVPSSSSGSKLEAVAELVQALPRKIFTREAVLWVVALLLGGVTFAQGMDRLDGGMGRRVAPLETRLDTVEQRQDSEARSTSQRLDQLSADNHETQLDVRELYRVIRTGRPSERLESPLVRDGGP